MYRTPTRGVSVRPKTQTHAQAYYGTVVRNIYKGGWGQEEYATTHKQVMGQMYGTPTRDVRDLQ